MEQKKKEKKQKSLYAIVMMIGMGFCGGIGGYALATFEKKRGEAVGPGLMILLAIGFALLLIAAFYFQIILHETGHMIFGLLSGYRFSSIRFGSVMLLKTEDGIKIKKMKMAGTAGQCLLLPPIGDETEYPVVLYNLGGLIMNLVLSGICLLVLLLLPERNSVAGLVFAELMVVGLTVFATNALPLSEMGTDGANTIILKKNKEARRAFRYALNIVSALSMGTEIGEMPSEWYAFDDSVPMDNPLVVGQAVNRFNYLMEQEQYEAAYEFGFYILDNASSINMLHKGAIRLELLFMDLVMFDRKEKAMEMHKTYEKDFKQIATLISCTRMQYAYYTLAEPDEKKAEAQKKLFETLAKGYPYKQEIRTERKMFGRIEEARTKAE